MEISEKTALNRLQDRIGYDYNQSDMARDFGVSRAFVSAVLRGERSMNADMLAAIGVRREKVTRYFLIEEE